MYFKFKTENLMVFCDCKFDIFIEFGYTATYFFIFKEYDENVKRDLLKIINEYKDWDEFVKAVDNIFKLNLFPEYYIWKNKINIRGNQDKSVNYEKLLID